MIQLNSLVSIIVRTSKKERLPLLKNALLSIISNDYRPIEIIIVVQSEERNFIQKIQDFSQEFTTKYIQIKLVGNHTSQDERAKNLNLGINTASGRYIGFLDDDDLIYPNHINVLVENLLLSGFVWAYSDVNLSINQIDNKNKINILSNELYFKKDKFSLDSFLQNNFIPIHSYLIDTNKISKQELVFDISLTVLEDYAFLLNLVAKTHPLYIPVITCEYRMFTDTRNTNFYINQYLGIDYNKKLQAWTKARNQLERLKKQLFPHYNSSKYVLRNIKFYLSRFTFLYKIKRIINLLINKQ